MRGGGAERVAGRAIALPPPGTGARARAAVRGDTRPDREPARLEKAPTGSPHRGGGPSRPSCCARPPRAGLRTEGRGARAPRAACLARARWPAPVGGSGGGTTRWGKEPARPPAYSAGRRDRRDWRRIRAPTSAPTGGWGASTHLALPPDRTPTAARDRPGPGRIADSPSPAPDACCPSPPGDPGGAGRCPRALPGSSKRRRDRA